MSERGSASCKIYRKRGHPQHSGGVQRWEEAEVADTLTIFDNTDARAPILIIQEVTDGNLQGFRESPTG